MAQNTRPRLGVAVSVSWVMPLEYSPETAMTPNAAEIVSAKRFPTSDHMIGPKPATDSSSMLPTARLTRAVIAMESVTPRPSVM